MEKASKAGSAGGGALFGFVQQRWLCKAVLVRLDGSNRRRCREVEAMDIQGGLWSRSILDWESPLSRQWEEKVL